MSTAKDFVSTLKEAGPKTSAYDTTATVIRIEGQTAWVHIPGGVNETPASLTIDAKPGDIVQVRVSGGRAFLIGNSSAPPTDDTTARAAKSTAEEAQANARKARDTAEEAGEAAGAAIHLAEGVHDHFWHNNTGAHVTQDTQEDYEADPANAGGNVLITSQGMAIRNGQKELAVFTADLARIGENNTSRIEMSSNNLSAFNDDSVKYFEIDMDAGSSTERPSKSCGEVLQAVSLTTTQKRIGGQPTIDMSDADSGSSASCSGATLVLEIADRVSAIGNRSNCEVLYRNSPSGDSPSSRIYMLCNGLNIDVDTGASVSAYANISLDGGASLYFQATVSYSAQSGVIILNVYGRSSVSLTINAFSSSVNVRYSVSTTAPAAVIGTRDDETPGVYSTAIGNHLYAAGNNQLVIGKYNEADENNEFAFIVGNGTSQDDADRSNAFMIDWNGHIHTQSGIVDSSTNYLTVSKSFTDSSQRVSLSSGNTNKTVLSVTAPITGIVIVSGYITMTSNANGNRHVTIRVGGTEVYNDTRPAHGTNNGQMGCSAAVLCNAGDTIEIMAWQSSGSTLYAGGRLNAVFM